MDLKTLANSLAGAADVNPASYGTVNDTASNTAEMGNIRNMSALLAGGDIASQVSSSIGTGAAERAAQEEAARRAAIAKKNEEARRAAAELEALEDPKNYRAVINDAGGYDFYDPMGGKISARDYAKVKNVQMVDLYKDSQDPNDKYFVDDYNTVMELGRALQSGDVAARDKIFEKNPVFKAGYENATLQEIVSDMHKLYPGYFRSDSELSGVGGSLNQSPLNTMVGEKNGTSTKQRILSFLSGFL